MKIALKLPVALLLLSNVALADPNMRWARLPFKQTLDMEVVHEITSSKPEQLINLINRHGVKVLRVVTKNPKKPLNPTLAGLEVAPTELLKNAEFDESDDGQMVAKSDPYCNLIQDTILIRDTALNYTLIHEFLHSAFNVSPDSKRPDIDMKFRLAYNRLNKYKDALFREPTNLLNPLWRRDILDAEKGVVAMLFSRIELTLSQEAIIERILFKLIDPNNPYFDGDRQNVGMEYGRFMINKAISIYSTAFETITWTKNTVDSFEDQIRLRYIIPLKGDHLTKTQALSFQAASDKMLTELAVIGKEIEGLKRFYSNW
ncbi:MAG: hypothetical protein IPK04_15175 [Bdellovibrionales bacterium]|jgi:hypothetical protein|nr:hypothetical protein [Bdellovibrionales bacterium]